MLLSKISSRGSGVKSMTVPDQDRRARKFEHIAGESSYRGRVLEQTRGVAAADSTVLSQRENRRKVRSAGFWAAPLALFLLPATVSLSQRLRCPGRVSQDAGIPRAARAALPVRRGRGASFPHALHGRRDGLSGSPDQRNQHVLGGIRPRAGSTQRIVGAGSVV